MYSFAWKVSIFGEKNANLLKNVGRWEPESLETNSRNGCAKLSYRFGVHEKGNQEQG